MAPSHFLTVVVAEMDLTGPITLFDHELAELAIKQRSFVKKLLVVHNKPAYNLETNFILFYSFISSRKHSIHSFRL